MAITRERIAGREARHLLRQVQELAGLAGRCLLAALMLGLLLQAMGFGR
ncbi:hypothetical protein [Siccirubricoccus phaeus]|nr:hypothetical protein [Siccirubricoccus phaeus]